MLKNKIFILARPEEIELFCTSAGYPSPIWADSQGYEDRLDTFKDPTTGKFFKHTYNKLFKIQIEKNWGKIDYLFHLLNTENPGRCVSHVTELSYSNLSYCHFRENQRYLLRHRNMDPSIEADLRSLFSTSTAKLKIRDISSPADANELVRTIELLAGPLLAEQDEITRRNFLEAEFKLKNQEMMLRRNLMLEIEKIREASKSECLQEARFIDKGHRFSLQWKQPLYQAKDIQSTITQQLTHDGSIAAQTLKASVPITNQTSALQYMILLDDFVNNRITTQTSANLYGIVIDKEKAKTLRIESGGNRQTLTLITQQYPDFALWRNIIFNLRTRHPLPPLPKIDNDTYFYDQRSRNTTLSLEEFYKTAYYGSTESSMPLDANLPTLVETQNDAAEFLKNLVDSIIKNAPAKLPDFHIITSNPPLLILREKGFLNTEIFNLGEILTNCNFKLFATTYQNHYSNTPQRAHEAYQAIQNLCTPTEINLGSRWSHVKELGASVNLTEAECLAIYLYTHDVDQSSARNARKLYSEINATFRGDFATLKAHHGANTSRQLCKILLISAIATVALKKLEGNTTSQRTTAAAFGFRAIRHFTTIHRQIDTIRQAVADGFHATPQLGFTSTSARDTSFGTIGTTAAVEIPTITMLLAGVNRSYIGNLSAAPGETETLMYPNSYVRWLHLNESYAPGSPEKKYLAVGQVVDPAEALTPRTLNARAQKIKPHFTIANREIPDPNTNSPQFENFIFNKFHSATTS